MHPSEFPLTPCRQRNEGTPLLGSRVRHSPILSDPRPQRASQELIASNARCSYTLANCDARTNSSLRLDVDMLSYSLPNFRTGLATLGRAGIRGDLGRPWLS